MNRLKLSKLSTGGAAEPEWEGRQMSVGARRQLQVSAAAANTANNKLRLGR